jgi:hypothetical protein
MSAQMLDLRAFFSWRTAPAAHWVAVQQALPEQLFHRLNCCAKRDTWLRLCIYLFGFRQAYTSLAMKKYGILSALALLVAFILAACGGGGGITLGPFPAIAKTEGDAPFALVAPTSASPAEFAYSSSDPKIATISGNTVTVLLAGTTTITASQASMGQWSATRTSAVLTVSPRVCTAPSVRENGVCVQPCIAPAVRQGGACVAPAAVNASYVVRSSRAWMPVASMAHWSDANSFCTTSTINGATGWRLPTEFELADLFTSGAMNGQGWTLAKTWSSTVSGSAHLAVDLSNGVSAAHLDSNSAYVTCVK